MEDHPRRCGENNAVYLQFRVTVGSPPQVRGKLSLFSVCPRNTRITPAGAGKTCAVSAGSSCVTDHPRRCGENRCSPSYRGSISGSPPQVRGKLLCDVLCMMDSRITPAGAGKTRGYGKEKGNDGDHPRRCGENFRDGATRNICNGSPPQVRGKPPINGEEMLRMRITPAGAGKTTLSPRTADRAADHPRRCGENFP